MRGKTSALFILMGGRIAQKILKTYPAPKIEAYQVENLLIFKADLKCLSRDYKNQLIIITNFITCMEEIYLS